MKKEVGSIYPLSEEEISLAEQRVCSFTTGRIYYSLCREAFYDIAQSTSSTNKRVLIPAYTCQTVITPFEEAGWDCEYYGIKKNLRIDIHHLQQLIEDYLPSLIVAHPFFGMDLNEEEQATLQAIHDKGIIVVIDLTQCLFSKQSTPFADYVVGSYRKWFPIPDGGFLIQSNTTPHIQQPLDDNVKFTERELEAMYLRGHYFKFGDQRVKKISIRLSKEADHMAEKGIKPHRMSPIAYQLFLQQDQVMNQKKRFKNYTFLFKHIKESNRVAKVCDNLNHVTTAPLYFTIYVEGRPDLQRQLAQDAIYAPVIWPVEDERVLINNETKYIYDHLLAIPCDQRYGNDDMQRAVNIINHYKDERENSCYRC